MRCAKNVTVGITTFRRPSMLKEALTSLFRQTTDGFQISVGNNDWENPLSDEALGIRSDGRVTYFNHKSDLGQLENMRFLLTACNTQWFTWLNDDDLMHPRCIEVLLAAALNSEIKPIAVYCDYFATPKPGEFWEIEEPRSSLLLGSDFAAGYSQRLIPLLGTYGLLDCKQLKQSNALRVLGNSISPYSDILIPLVLASRGQVAYVHEKLFVLRTHTGSLSVRNTDPAAYLSNHNDLLAVVSDTLAGVLSPRDYQQCINNLLKWFARDHWHLLMRSSPKARWRNAATLFNDQLRAHSRRLSLRQRLDFCTYLLHLVTKQLRFKLNQSLQFIRAPRFPALMASC